MPQPSSRAGFAQKTKPRRFITEISFADDLQGHRASEIDVERFVSDPHCTATQLDRFPVFARHQLVVLKSFHRPFRRRPSCFLDRRLAGLNAADKTLAEHTDRTEFHRSRKLIAAARAGALGLFAHGSNRPSVAASARSNTTLAPSGAKSPGPAPSKLLSRSTSNCVFAYLSPSNHIPEQNSNRRLCPIHCTKRQIDRGGGSCRRLRCQI